jgi:hypothetical protein
MLVFSGIFFHLCGLAVPFPGNTFHIKVLTFAGTDFFAVYRYQK